MRWLAILALVAGCEGLTSSSQPRVSVLKRTNEGCFSLITQDTPIAPELGVSDVCPYLSEPLLLAAVDRMEVVVDYGPDVTFAGDTHAPAPDIELALDGAPSDVLIEESGEQRAGTRAFFVATFYTPAQLSTDVRITAGVGAGFRTEVPVTFSILPTPVDLSLVNCAGGSTCELTGGVGRASLRVVVPGDRPQVVSLRGTLDGTPQPDALPPVTTQPVGDHTEIIAPIPIPAARDGALWVIGGQIYTTQTAAVSAVIRAPAVTSALSCGTTCALSTGQAVGLAVSAPNGIEPAQAIVDTAIDGVPQLVHATVPLVETAMGTATGQLALHAPATSGTWQIDVHVAGYAAPTIAATVH